MSEEPPAKRVRKGTKSCIECRQRKVRCIWLTEGSETCNNCLARNRTCQLQIHMTPASDAVGSTSRARIESLENNVNVLWTTVRRLEEKLGDAPTGIPRQTQVQSSREDSSDPTTNDPPAHILQLLDNDLLGSRDQEPLSPSRHVFGHQYARKSSALWALMPSRQDLLFIIADASKWMTLFNSLFPSTGVIKDGGEMISMYDKLQRPNADPVAVASLLLSVAITVKQAPQNLTLKTASGFKDRNSLIAEISDAVEKTVIADDDMLESLEGLACGMIFVRLQLGRSRMKKVWLTLRRIISLAELTGLPRAAVAVESQSRSSTDVAVTSLDPTLPQKQQRQKAEMWESICAIDRISSMMWSLPLATANFTLPTRPLYDTEGRINQQSFLYRLVNIASHMLDLDGVQAIAKPTSDLMACAMSVDGELRSLASLLPKNWWQIQWPELSPDALLQYWHRYITIRTHIKFALMYDNNEELALSFIVCFNACQELAERYISLRRVSPDGFFANPVLDLQAFTSTVFLLLAAQRPHPRSVNVDSSSLVSKVIQTLERAADSAGQEPVRPAAEAIKSLRSLLEQSSTSETPKISVYLPLFGKVHVSRKPRTVIGSHDQTDFPSTISGGQQESVLGRIPELPNALDPLDLSMEFPDDYLYLTDRTFEVEDWLTWEV